MSGTTVKTFDLFSLANFAAGPGGDGGGASPGELTPSSADAPPAARDAADILYGAQPPAAPKPPPPESPTEPTPKPVPPPTEPPTAPPPLAAKAEEGKPPVPPKPEPEPEPEPEEPDWPALDKAIADAGDDEDAKTAATKAKDDAKTAYETAKAAFEAAKTAFKVDAVVLPEGFELGEENSKSLETMFRTIKLTQDQGQKMVDTYCELMARQREVFLGQIDEWLTQAKGDKDMGGDRWDATVTNAKRFTARYGTPALKEYLADYGGGNHPEIIRAFARAGAELTDDKPVTAETAAPQKRDAIDILYPSSNST